MMQYIYEEALTSQCDIGASIDDDAPGFSNLFIVNYKDN